MVSALLALRSHAHDHHADRLIRPNPRWSAGGFRGSRPVDASPKDVKTWKQSPSPRRRSRFRQSYNASLAAAGRANVPVRCRISHAQVECLAA